MHPHAAADRLSLAPGRRTARSRGYAGKRVFDICVAAVLLGIAAPAIALLWALVRADGGGGFFGHARVGRDGRVFRCWKLRSMVPDAESRLATILATDPAAAAEWARRQKLSNDPRVTGLGRVLRRTRLDELPQLWNVLRGEMSLVGPRPVTRAELGRYGSAAPLYLALRPGLTGPWQVSGEDGGDYAARVRRDAAYARQCSLGGDLWLLIRTCAVVLARTGE
ncbi:sugar transferase [Rhodovulum sp. YNF3179]|uniref:sugar transferase n=1 Tax=Rhodovulum sp. YNF3179 TaxID=3425127 RepID=UPI003D32C97D